MKFTEWLFTSKKRRTIDQTWGRDLCADAQAYADERCTQLEAERDSLRQQLAEARKASLVPGIMHCAKCKFQLVRNNLNVNSGTITAGDSKTEPCPNGCGPLWPVTWETYGKEGWETAERFFDEKQTAEQRLAEAEGQEAVGETSFAEGVRFYSTDVRESLPFGTKLYLHPTPPAPDVRVPEGWKHIETAPAGHELLLLWQQHERGGFMFVGCKTREGEWINNLDLKRQNPDFWMPTPEAPCAISIKPNDYGDV